MNSKYLACALLLPLFFAASASAQLIAGSAEDDLFGQIEAASTPAEQLQLALRFEREFPESPVKLRILTMITNIYNQQQDSANAIAYAEKTLMEDEDNVEALIALTYNIALSGQNLAQAIEYGQRAVAAIDVMRNSEPPAGYSAEAWSQYAETLGTTAASYLNYAETIR